MRPKNLTTVVQTIRQSLLKMGFAEIIPELLSPTIPTEPTIYPFQIHHQFLATSPESYLKQAMAAGAGKCFAISSAFRALEQIGKWHQPAFLMAEWYAPHTNYQDMMSLTQNLITDIYKFFKLSLNQPFIILSLIDLWQKYLHTDYRELARLTKMAAFADSKGYNSTHATWEQLFNQIVLNEIELHFPQEPFFLTDYPAQISPLAKPKNDDSLVAERFELFINKIELANGNTENLNAVSIQKSMAEEIIYRQSRGLPHSPLDQEFIQAIQSLHHQYPTSTLAGVGLGLNRLGSVLLNNHYR